MTYLFLNLIPLLYDKFLYFCNGMKLWLTVFRDLVMDRSATQRVAFYTTLQKIYRDERRTDVMKNYFLSMKIFLR
jgi:hypothetical protein